jgi:hypothetical protein
MHEYIHYEHTIIIVRILPADGSIELKHVAIKKKEQQGIKDNTKKSWQTVFIVTLYTMRFYWKAPGLRTKKKRCLNLISFGCHLLQKCSSWKHTVIPFFFPCFKTNVKVILLNAVKYCL